MALIHCVLNHDGLHDDDDLPHMSNLTNCLLSLFQTAMAVRLKVILGESNIEKKTLLNGIPES